MQVLPVAPDGGPGLHHAARTGHQHARDDADPRCARGDHRIRVVHAQRVVAGDP